MKTFSLHSSGIARHCGYSVEIELLYDLRLVFLTLLTTTPSSDSSATCLALSAASFSAFSLIVVEINFKNYSLPSRTLL